MALDGTYETKLLRILIGYSHVAVLQQIALTRHGKPLHSLIPEDRNALEQELIGAVGLVANALSDEALKGSYIPPPIVH